MKRLVLWSSGLLLALLLAAGGGFWWLVRRNLPDGAAPAIPGLSAEVRVAFDDRGVATISAASWPDALRVQGYLTARDRLFQLELQRRAGEGTLSELFGKAALDLDRRRRTYGYSRVAARAVGLLPDEERANLEALSAASTRSSALTPGAGASSSRFSGRGRGPSPRRTRSWSSS